MKSVIFSKFRVSKYLKHMKWKKLPDNHWAQGKDGQEAHWNGNNWIVDGYIVSDDWIGE